jgi:hypothetical protein
MSTGQLIILGIGAVIILTSVDFTSLFNSVKNSIPEVPKPAPVPTPKPSVPVVVEEKDDLVEVVKKWDDLKDTCEELGLNEAVEKLNEIFPMLIKVDK